MLTARYGGVPGWLWMAGAAAIVYFLFLRNKSGGGGPSSSGGGGTSTTGDISIQPGTTTIQVQGSDIGSTGAGPVTVPNPNPVPVDNDTGQGSGSGVPNPQPTPHHPPRKITHHVPVQHKANPFDVTVAKWPGKSQGGLAQWNTTLWGIARHENTTVADLLKLNPHIRNANLIYPGEKIRVR